MRPDLNYKPNKKRKRIDNILLFLACLCALIALCLASCKTTQTSTNNHELIKKDSAVSIINNIKDVFDSTAYLPPVKLATAIPHPCDSIGNIKPINTTMQSGKARAKIFTQHDTLYIDCDCGATVDRLRVEKYKSDSALLKANSTIETLGTNINTTKIEFKTPWYVHWEMAGLALVIVALLLWILKLKLF